VMTEDAFQVRDESRVLVATCGRIACFPRVEG